MSACLADCSIEHVIFERYRLGERWRSERWDSLRLLTPNWMSRLPGFQYDGPEPDGYMTMPEFVGYLERFARHVRAPIEEGTEVQQLDRSGKYFVIRTNRGIWNSENVVIATGYCDQPAIPPMAGSVSSDILQLSPTRYRNPRQLPEGGVLVVGAAASGIQLADEISESGRPVTIAAGRHLRMLRCYRGKDILWWLDRMGILDQTTDQVYDLETSRQQPAFQLVGRSNCSSIDLASLAARGIRVTGRVLGVDGDRFNFADDLISTTASADVKLADLLGRIDRFVDKAGFKSEANLPEPFVPIWPAFFSYTPPASIDLRKEGIRTVIWATGFRRSYPWLRLPVFDERGEIVQREGITAEPGLFVLGLQFGRCRKSAFIDGVGLDAEWLTKHLTRRTSVSSAVA